MDLAVLGILHTQEGLHMILAGLVEISSHPRDETLKLALVIVHLAVSF